MTCYLIDGEKMIWKLYDSHMSHHQNSCKISAGDSWYWQVCLPLKTPS